MNWVSPYNKKLGMDYFTFEVKGLKEMEDRLLQFPEKIGRNILAAATHEGARLLRDAARGKAPIGTRTYKDWKGRTHRPGYLRKFGEVTKKLKTKNWQTTVVYGVGFSKRGFYGRFIERGKSKKHHQEPRPFILPLLDPMKEQIVEAIKRRLGERMDEVIREIPGLIKT
jgi:HK97 gp10 family phage protein